MTGGDDKAKGRVRVIAWAVVFLFAALTTRLWFLQVLAAEEYRARANSNRVRLVPLEAPRGRILDRDGKVLVGNRGSVVVTIDRRKVEDLDGLLFKLSGLLGVPAEDLAERLHDPRFLPYQPIPVYEDAPERVIHELAEHSRDYPGVSWQLVGVRDYPRNRLAVHVLGYLGQISREELDDPAFDGYRPGARVGRGGVEARYERVLRGREGWQKLEVDSRGKVLNELGHRAPVPGRDVVLSIDTEVQELAEESLRAGVAAAKTIVHAESGRYLRAPAGSVVVLDPRNGQVLALASFPTYDPEVFLGGLTQREWERLNDPSRNYPLNNRAIQASYPPGSTLKPFVAAAAIRAGLARPDGYYPCPPTFMVPGDTSNTVFRNWTAANLGTISLAEALVQSCDTVFYRFGLGFYQQRRQQGDVFQRFMEHWGFSHATGIDLPFEATGRLPDEAWKQRMHERYPKLFPDSLWYPGDNINMSIGQGDLLVTPLQLATAFAALANGGEIHRPRVGLRVETPDGEVVQEFPPHVVGRLPYRPGVLQTISDSLRGVTARGTAAGAFAGFPLSQIPVAGKTGTAEVAGRQPHSWFAAYAPADRPRVVVVAMVEEGGHGSQVAAPIVRRVLEGLFGLTQTGIHIGPAQD